jgi:hypothetical protein
MKLVRNLFESSRKMRKMFPAFREGGTVHAPKACAGPPLSTTPPLVGARGGHPLGAKADPSRFGARDDSVGSGHPKRRGNGCRAEGPLRSSAQAGATLEAKADPSGKSCPRDDSPRVGHPKRRGNGCRAEGPLRSSGQAGATLKAKQIPRAKAALVMTGLGGVPEETRKRLPG